MTESDYLARYAGMESQSPRHGAKHYGQDTGDLKTGMEYPIDDIVSDGLRSVETNGRSDKTVEHL
jgi:hypothetical protein